METNETLKSIFYAADGTERGAETIILHLKEKSINVPDWNVLVKDYDPKQHEIITNPKRRPKDKTKGDQQDKVAKVTYPAERNTVRRLAQMMFTIPVKREYKYDDSNETQKKICNAIESIYDGVRINGENCNRFRALFASCELMTVWYSVLSENEDYGFKSKYKLRCRSYSPMPNKFSKITQAKLYPLFDDYGDMVAMSFEYNVQVGTNTYTKFETFTANTHYRWISGKDSLSYEQDIQPEEINIMKIPAIYAYRTEPCFSGVSNNRDEIEFTLSRTSDIIRKNSAPIYKIKGTLIGDMPVSDRAKEIYQFADGTGDIDTVTPSITPENAAFYIGQLQKNIEEDMQLPNLSLENTKSLGALTGEARKTLLTDAHLRVGEEQHEIVWFLDRECNVIKSFLAKMNTSWEKEINNIKIKHVITPFTMNDEDANIKKASSAANGVQFASQKTLIETAGLVTDVAAELERIKIEQEQTSAEGPMQMFKTAE